MRILGKYRNGNYTVTIFDDGTKVRSNDLDFFAPEKPESMDIKITNMCDMGCPFCHENSTADGLHGDIMHLKFMDTLLPYTELAIGGGNPLTHPDLIPFLKKCRDLHLIPSMTINQIHFMKDEYIDLIDMLVRERLIYGLGISLVNVTDEFIKRVKKFPNAVIHLINGVHTLYDIEKLYDHDLKILILGYKQFRRGINYYSNEVELIKKDVYNELENIVEHFKVVSFDNLALKQLEAKRLLSQEDWDQFFMGDDGSATCYLDLVNKTYAICSVSALTERYPLTEDIGQMFKHIQQLRKTEVRD